MTSRALLASTGREDLDSCLSPISFVETALKFPFSVLLISEKQHKLHYQYVLHEDYPEKHFINSVWLEPL